MNLSLTPILYVMNEPVLWCIFAIHSATYAVNVFASVPPQRNCERKIQSNKNGV